MQVKKGDTGEKSLTVPIAQTSTYVFEDTHAVKAFVAGQNPQIDYGRYGNPTQHAAEIQARRIGRCRGRYFIFVGHECCDDYATGHAVDRAPRGDYG